VVAIGVFDGVHRGHQRVIAHAVAAAARIEQPVVALTFDPHPDAVLAGRPAPRLLGTVQRRRELLTGLGASTVRVLPFTADLARLSPGEFAASILAGQLRARYVVVGENFRFGRHAAGDVALLSDLGSGHGFGTEGVPLVSDGGQVISSATVRALVAAGDVAGAAGLLGRPHGVEGTAAGGPWRRAPARVPVIRLKPAAGSAVPADGAYAGWLVQLDSGGAPAGRWPAAVWVGAGPAPGGWAWGIRVHRLDGDERDLDGQRLAVDFASRISGQVPADGMAALAAEHVIAARAVLRGQAKDTASPAGGPPPAPGPAPALTPQAAAAGAKHGGSGSASGSGGRLRSPLLLAKPVAGHGGRSPDRAEAGTSPRSLLGPGGPEPARPGSRRSHVEALGALGDTVVSGDDSHLMTIAPTGAGKGRDVIIPNLLSYDGSVVVFDPKGENYDVTHRYRRDVLGHQIVLLDPFASSHTGAEERDCLNPFDVQAHLALRRGESLAESAGDFGRLLAEILGGGFRSLSDPFWDEMAQLLIAGLAADMITHKSDHSRNLPELRRRLFSRNVRNYISSALAEREADMDPGTAQEFRMLISIGAAETTFAGIVATAAQQLAPFSSRSTVESISATSFDLTALTDPAKRISLYIVLPPHKLRTHQRLLRAWVGSLLYLVMNNQGGGTQLLFMIDEAAQLGRFSLLEEAITLLRGYGMRTWTFWQDLAQVESLYGISAETMINNSGVLQAFGATNFRSAAALASRLGCDPGELFAMDEADQVVAFRGEWPVRLQRFNYLTDNQLASRSDPNPRFS
jgi:riboflavin kinase/FMN adenylyltransferase